MVVVRFCFVSFEYCANHNSIHPHNSFMGLSPDQVSIRANDDFDLILNSPSEEAYKEVVLRHYQSGSNALFALFPDRFTQEFMTCVYALQYEAMYWPPQRSSSHVPINPSHLPT